MKLLRSFVPHLCYSLTHKNNWILTLLFLFCALPAQAALELRVAIEEGESQVRVGTSTAANVRDRAGNTLGQLEPMQGLPAESQRGNVKLGRWQSGQVWIEPTGDGYIWIDDRWYRGKVHLVATSGGLLAVNHVDLEEYLYSVTASEMPSQWPLEALKAQAVAARSYALYKRSRLANQNYDLGDSTNWQVYHGIKAETSSTQSAVQATAGQVLTHGGEIIEAVFHSSSGGHTENAEDVWTQAVPYLRGVADFDHQAPVFSWQEQFTAEQLRRRITGVGNIMNMTPVSITPHGRIRQMKVIGDAGERTLSGDELRWALNLRSSLFAVAPQGGVASASGKADRPAGFVVTGRGFGHGLGLSQWGAYSLALRGYSYQQILGHYYQNASLARIDVVP